MIFTLVRVAFGVIMTVICVFVLGKKKYNWVRFGLYFGTFCFLAYDIFWKVILIINDSWYWSFWLIYISFSRF